MKMIDDIRAENMRQLATECGGNAQLAERLGRSESQISQWINRSTNYGTGKPRGMRSGTARWIETTMGKPKGWIDQDHETPSISRSDDANVNALRIESPAATYSSNWPFRKLRIERVSALPQSELEIIEGMLIGAIESVEARLTKHPVPQRPLKSARIYYWPSR